MKKTLAVLLVAIVATVALLPNVTLVWFRRVGPMATLSRQRCVLTGSPGAAAADEDDTVKGYGRVRRQTKG
jgi:hypothetical protein